MKIKTKLFHFVLNTDQNNQLYIYSTGDILEYDDAIMVYYLYKKGGKTLYKNIKIYKHIIVSFSEIDRDLFDSKLFEYVREFGYVYNHLVYGGRRTLVMKADPQPTASAPLTNKSVVSSYLPDNELPEIDPEEAQEKLNDLRKRFVQALG